MNVRRFKIAALSSIIATGSLGLLACRAVLAQVGLEPMVIQETVERGRAQGVLTVTNPGAQPMRVRVYAEPFTYDRETGFTSLSEDAQDLTPYLQFSPREFVIPPGERQRVRLVSLLPPSLTGPEYRAVVFTEALLETVSAEETSSNTIQARIGSTVYIRQPDAAPELSLVSAQWDQASAQVQVLVSNSGNASARPNLKWTLAHDGVTVATGESGATTVIAGLDRLFVLSGSSAAAFDLASGNYEISGELVWDLGDESYSQPFKSGFSVP
jgi:P pilus assembly chaperone PapD